MNATQLMNRKAAYHAAVVNAVYSFFKLNEDYQPGLNSQNTFPEYVRAMDDLVFRVNPGQGTSDQEIIARIMREMRGAIMFTEELDAQQLADNSIFITSNVVQTSEALDKLLKVRGFAGTISNGFIVVEFEGDESRSSTY